MSSSGTRYHISQYVTCDKFSLHHHKFLAAIIAKREPIHFLKDVKDARWRDTIQKKAYGS